MTSKKGIHGLLNKERPDNVQRKNVIKQTNKKATRNAPMQRVTRFEGKSNELQGHIYDCSDTNQADRFTRTTKEIAEFVGRSYSGGGDIRRAVEKLKLPTFVQPDDPPDNATPTIKRVWEKKVDAFVIREERLLENIQMLYSLVWGQCTDIMRQQVEGMAEYEEMSEELDGLALLKAIKYIVYNTDSQQYINQSLHEARCQFYNCVQGKHTTTQVYLSQFMDAVEGITHCGGSIGNDKGSIEFARVSSGATKDKMTVKEIQDMETAIKETAKEQYLATAFFLGADRQRFGQLIDDTQNSFLQGINTFPMTITSAYNLLNKWKPDQHNNTPFNYTTQSNTAKDVSFIDVEYSCKDVNCFELTGNDGTQSFFQESKDGPYFQDISDKAHKYSSHDYSQAVLARKIQRIIGRPSIQEFLHIVDNNQILNCPITCKDILAAVDIFGSDKGIIKGKTLP